MESRSDCPVNLKVDQSQGEDNYGSSTLNFPQKFSLPIDINSKDYVFNKKDEDDSTSDYSEVFECSLEDRQDEDFKSDSSSPSLYGAFKKFSVTSSDSAESAELTFPSKLVEGTNTANDEASEFCCGVLHLSSPDHISYFKTASEDPTFQTKHKLAFKNCPSVSSPDNIEIDHEGNVYQSSAQSADPGDTLAKGSSQALGGICFEEQYQAINKSQEQLDTLTNTNNNNFCKDGMESSTDSSSDFIIEEVSSAAETELEESLSDSDALDLDTHEFSIKSDHGETAQTSCEPMQPVDIIETGNASNYSTPTDEELLGNISELSDHLTSPVLKCSLVTPQVNRIDCRDLFLEDTSITEEISKVEEPQQYRSLRDSLDIAKNKKLDSTSKAFPLVSWSSPADASVAEEAEEEILTDDLSQLPLISHLSNSVTAKKRKKDTGVKTNLCQDRRVSFPKEDTSLITSYLEPANPWCNMRNVNNDDICAAYSQSCERHETMPLSIILQQIAALPLCFGGRVECLNLRNQKLEPNQCECLEELFRRVQFKTLILEGCGLDDDTVIPLFDMIEFYDSATHINISCNSKIGLRGWQACARLLRRNPSIEILDAHSTNFNETNLLTLAKAFRLGISLRTLHLENCNLTGRCLILLAGALKVNCTVTELYLADNRLGANDSIQIGNLLRANKILKLLDLRNNNIQDTGCSHIAEGIVEQQSKTAILTALYLWNNHLTIQSVPHISSILLSASTIEVLNLGKNNLNSIGVLQLKSSLIKNRCMKQLGLQATRIGNEGAVALAEYIADNPVIERIDLRENNIQVAGLMALSQSLRINKSVVQIDLDNNAKLEPSLELVNQHGSLLQEIKSYCLHNKTDSHFKDAHPHEKEGIMKKGPYYIESSARKISLTCDRGEYVATPVVNEPKKYFSPAPSPSASPCPSPSLSPSPSPVPSPSKSRFEVFRVSESNAIDIFPKGNDDSLFSTSSLSGFSMPIPTSLSSSLPSLTQAAKPNRFSMGGRFTVTRVKEESLPFKSCLPATRAMSSPSLIISNTKEETGPIIVVSSPNKPVQEFIEGTRDALPNPSYHDLAAGNCYKEPLLDETIAGKTAKQKSLENCHPGHVADELPFKAPLALMEAESFESDSEDSEVTTQSSDSTRSDEVKIGTEQVVPIQAWQIKEDSTSVKDQTFSQNS